MVDDTIVCIPSIIEFYRCWDADEDALIIKLVEEHGAGNWAVIAANMNCRTGKQCRERYHNHLQPDIKKGI